MLKEDSGYMEVDFNLSADERIHLLRIARESLAAVVSGEDYLPELPEEGRLLQNAGAFVTLHLHGELRGCIGLIEPYLPLYESVSEMAAKAAIADPRFDRVSKSEVEEIEIEISVLSPLRKVQSAEEVVVGKHGILIENRFYRGLLLPQVATENGWDRTQFLQYVCLKAGLEKEDYRKPESKLFVFTAEVFGETKARKKEEEDIVEGT
jgi:uncharacterized protein